MSSCLSSVLWGGGSRARYTSGRGPTSLFRDSGWETICHDSSRQRWEVLGWWSMTVAWSQSMAWFVVSACSAAADVMQFPVVRALLCSLTHCMRDLPVWPVYALGHSVQGMR